jgi:hypothetical protein
MRLMGGKLKGGACANTDDPITLQPWASIPLKYRIDIPVGMGASGVIEHCFDIRSFSQHLASSPKEEYGYRFIFKNPLTGTEFAGDQLQFIRERFALKRVDVPYYNLARAMLTDCSEIDMALRRMYAKLYYPYMAWLNSFCGQSRDWYADVFSILGGNSPILRDQCYLLEFVPQRMDYDYIQALEAAHPQLVTQNGMPQELHALVVAMPKPPQEDLFRARINTPARLAVAAAQSQQIFNFFSTHYPGMYNVTNFVQAFFENVSFSVQLTYIMLEVLFGDFVPVAQLEQMTCTICNYSELAGFPH